MPTERDLETKNADTLLKRIKLEFQSLVWEKHTFLNHGWDHEVIILDDKIVFRFPNSSEYGTALKSEIDLLKFLSDKIQANIPRYKYIAKDYSFAGYDIIPGVELSEEVFAKLSDNEKKLIAEQIAKFLTAMHSLTKEELSPFKIDKADMPSETKRLRQQSKQYLEGVLNNNEYRKLTEILDELDSLDSESIPSVLVHNDMSTSHIFWDSDTRKIGVIDFSDRCLGDPAFDFTGLLDYGDEFFEQTLSFYSGPNGADLANRARLYKRRVGVYLLVDSFMTDKITFQEAKRLFDKNS
jgi:aminoglycoside phosphotransferase (APT) family kinase protein